jgi:hypothetical protein
MWRGLGKVPIMGHSVGPNMVGVQLCNIFVTNLVFFRKKLKALFTNN